MPTGLPPAWVPDDQRREGFRLPATAEAEGFSLPKLPDEAMEESGIRYETTPKGDAEVGRIGDLIARAERAEGKLEELRAFLREKFGISIEHRLNSVPVAIAQMTKLAKR